MLSFDDITVSLEGYILRYDDPELFDKLAKALDWLIAGYCIEDIIYGLDLDLEFNKGPVFAYGNIAPVSRFVAREMQDWSVPHIKCRGPPNGRSQSVEEDKSCYGTDIGCDLSIQRLGGLNLRPLAIPPKNQIQSFKK